MKSDILRLKEVTSMDKTHIHWSFLFGGETDPMMSVPSCDTQPILAQTSFPTSHCWLCAGSQEIYVKHTTRCHSVFPHLALQLLPGAFRMAFPSIVLRVKFCQSGHYTTLEESWGAGWGWGWGWGRVSRKNHLPDFLIHRNKPHLKIPPEPPEWELSE